MLDKEKIAAWAVHGFTASGAVLGFLAIISIFNNDQTSGFFMARISIISRWIRWDNC